MYQFIIFIKSLINEIIGWLVDVKTNKQTNKQYDITFNLNLLLISTTD